ncbi:MAG: hypothetical protein NTV94_18010, partial [Planctomycetota bacterium]|nr:hypothetical protein [Planctomycetota bacterium]
SESGGDWRARGAASRSGARFSFSPGPGATTNPISITALGFAVDQAGTGAQTPSSSFTLRVSFFLDPVGGPAVTALALPATPDATITGDFNNFSTPGYISFYAGAPIALTAPLTLGSATKLPQGFYTVEIFQLGSTTVRNTEVGPSLRGLVAPNPGSNDGVRWADANNDGIFLATEGLGSLTNRRNVYLNLQGDVPPPPPPSFVDVGCLADGLTTRTNVVAGGAVQFYKICLNGDATANARQYLSIDTNGSSAPAAIGIYNTLGVVAGLDGNDEGSGDSGAAQMSFGIGRHAGTGTAQQLDGRAGGLLAGEYYVAVGGAGTTFGGSFSTSAGPVGGTMTVNFRTNTNGGALPPAVAPTIPSGNDLDVLTAPGAPGVVFTIPALGTHWYKFNLCSDITAPLFLDIDFFQTAGIADPQTYLFDSNGNVVITSDDSATTSRPQLSFGDAGPRTQSGGPDAFTGQSGATLAAGTYYLGTGLFSTVSTNDRWDLRGTSGSSLSYQVNFWTNLDSSTCGAACPACAADYNIDGGVDGADIAAFFPDWEASATCADVNQDGGVDGGDIESFFAVWEAGGC